VCSGCDGSKPETKDGPAVAPDRDAAISVYLDAAGDRLVDTLQTTLAVEVSGPADTTPEADTGGHVADALLPRLDTQAGFDGHSDVWTVDAFPDTVDAPASPEETGGRDVSAEGIGRETVKGIDAAQEAGSACPTGSAWCGGDGGYACIDINYDAQNCGACGKACTGSGTECCNGVCVAAASYATDPNNCGVCGNVCPAPSDDSDACLFFDQCKKPTCNADFRGTIVCNPETVTGCTGCLAGCCKGTVCMSGNTDSACGRSGGPCDTCTGGARCMGGSCECTDFSCGI
jgi:hypothetical protein